VNTRASQLERVGLPSADTSVGSNTDEHRDANSSNDWYLRESDGLDTGSVFVTGHLSENGTLNEVDSSETSLRSSADGDRASGVDGDGVDSTLETESTVGGEEFVDGLSGSRVPKNERSIF